MASASLGGGSGQGIKPPTPRNGGGSGWGMSGGNGDSNSSAAAAARRRALQKVKETYVGRTTIRMHSCTFSGIEMGGASPLRLLLMTLFLSFPHSPLTYAYARTHSIFFGGKKQVLSARDREMLVEKWGDKVQRVEEEAFHLFSSLDRYAYARALFIGLPVVMIDRSSPPPSHTTHITRFDRTP